MKTKLREISFYMLLFIFKSVNLFSQEHNKIVIEDTNNVKQDQKIRNTIYVVK